MQARSGKRRAAVGSVHPVGAAWCLPVHRGREPCTEQAIQDLPKLLAAWPPKPMGPLRGRGWLRAQPAPGVVLWHCGVGSPQGLKGAEQVLGVAGP